MEKEFWEHTSIVIETIGFFLVTLDLYGKKRLKETSDKILAIRAERIQAKDLSKEVISDALFDPRLGISTIVVSLLILIINLFQRLVSLFSLEGVMLSIGTILFLAAKTIDWILV